MKRSLRPTLELYGSVESPQDAELRAAVGAEVLQVNVREGDSVEQGQTLVVLDGRDAELELRQRQADVADTKAGLALEQRRLVRNREALVKEKELLGLTESSAERAASLYKERMVSQSNVDTSSEALKRQQLALTQRELAIEESEIGILRLRAQLARAEALRDRGRLDLERTVITAPFAGVISDNSISMGDRVGASDVLMRIHNPSQVEVRAQIPSRFAQAVREGLNSALEMPAVLQIGQSNLKGRLTRISGQTRRGSGGVEAFIGFVDTASVARLGATVRVLLELPPEPDVIAVPSEAIYGRDQLYRVADGRMSMLTVERVGERLSATGGSEVIVRSELLAQGDEIIVTKLSNSADGLLVTIASDGQATQSAQRQPGS